jgi:catechol 2,3-dioxygenase-like lactoylglutathione lyase family enzyme
LDRKLDGIDHLIVGVRDLEAARGRYARLGFALTPRGRHVGWGTANYCIMLEDEYLELLGIVDPASFTNNLDLFLEERGEGGLGLAVRSLDAPGTAAAWTTRGLHPAEPRQLGRVLETANGPQELRFRNIMLDREATLDLGLFACEHLTPELLRQPPWLQHPNGARGLRSCTVVVDDTGPFVEAMSRVFGTAAVTDTDNVLAVHSGTAVLLIAPPEDAALMHPAAAIEGSVPRPQLRVATIEVADAERAAAWLRQQGVPFRQTREGALIPPGEAHGLAIELVGG